VVRVALVVGLAMLVASTVSARTPAEQLLCSGVRTRNLARNQRLDTTDLDGFLAKAAYEVLMNKEPVSANSSTVVVTCFDRKLEITPKMAGVVVKQVKNFTKVVNK
jgi:hypothetical protein